MTCIALDSPLYLRDATKDDCDLVYQWRNRHDIIALSSTLQSVSWPEHLEWFTRSLKSDKRFIYIIMFNSAPVGKVRFDLISEQTAEISIYIIKEYTGQGLGVRGILDATAKIFRLMPELQSIIAFIRNENTRSIRAFMKASYFPGKTTLYRANHTALSIER